MKKNILKITSVIIAGSLLMSGCSSGLFGLPGLLYETAETISDLTEDTDLSDEMFSDMWEWPDGNEEEEVIHHWSDDDDEEDDEDDEKPDTENAETVTVLVYMNGSTLESEAGYASSDIAEMKKAGYSENVNVIIQTMGTKRWSTRHGIASDRSQTYRIGEEGLELIRDDLDQLDCTDPETLREFIEFGAEEYPADRYILILWDHGGGPAHGFGWDEYQPYSYELTIYEMMDALEKADVYFDFIGMDCCIMSCLEIACALNEYCDYMVLSEDFESGLGWYYTGWLKALRENSSISTEDLGKILIDDMIAKNEKDPINGDRAILALINEKRVTKLWKSWIDFAYANEEELLSVNYSQKLEESGKGTGLSEKHSRISRNDHKDDDDSHISDECITDLMFLAVSIESDESEKLKKNIENALVYVGATDDCLNLTGISITLPYGDSILYHDLKGVLRKCGFDDEYLEWLGKFKDVDLSESLIDWEKLGEEFWNEFGDTTGLGIWEDLDEVIDDDIWGNW